MNKIREIVEGLDEKERFSLMLELLIPYLRTLNGERTVADGDQVVGHVMSPEYRDDLLHAEFIDRFQNIDRSKCRPLSEIMKELKAKITAGV